MNRRKKIDSTAVEFWVIVAAILAVRAFLY